MACQNFKCEYETDKNECTHQNHFTTNCLETKCEGHSCCCMCVSDCDYSRIRNKK